MRTMIGNLTPDGRSSLAVMGRNTPGLVAFVGSKRMSAAIPTMVLGPVAVSIRRPMAAARAEPGHNERAAVSLMTATAEDAAISSGVNSRPARNGVPMV